MEPGTPDGNGAPPLSAADVPVMESLPLPRNQSIAHAVYEDFDIGFVPPLPPPLPAISQMLNKESDAWAALMSLHSSVLSAAHDAARVSHETALMAYDEAAEKSEIRETSYMTALSRLASSCDELFEQVVKLRSLRRGQKHFKLRSLAEVTRAHRDETLALGCELARTSALGLDAAASHLRKVVNSHKSQVEDMRNVLELARTEADMVHKCELVVGLRSLLNDEVSCLQPVDRVVEQALQGGNGTMTTKSICDALRGEHALPRVEPPGALYSTQQRKTFQRRSATRADGSFE